MFFAEPSLTSNRIFLSLASKWLIERNDVMDKLRTCTARSDQAGPCATNVGDLERTLSVLAGGFVLLHGLSKLRLSTIAAAVGGGALVYRGLTGHCKVYQALDMAKTRGLGHNEQGPRQRGPHQEVTDASLPATGESP